jgi:hypothetical protein
MLVVRLAEFGSDRYGAAVVCVPVWAIDCQMCVLADFEMASVGYCLSKDEIYYR